MQDTDSPGDDARRMLARLDSLARRLDADQLHAAVRHKGMEHAHRIRAAADAGDHCVRQFPACSSIAPAPPAR